MINLENHPYARTIRELQALQKRNKELGDKALDKAIREYHRGVHDGIDLAILKLKRRLDDLDDTMRNKQPR